MKQLKNGKRRKTISTFVNCQKVLFSGKSSFSSFSMDFSVHSGDLDILGAERVCEIVKNTPRNFKKPKNDSEMVFSKRVPF